MSESLSPVAKCRNTVRTTKPELRRTGIACAASVTELTFGILFQTTVSSTALMRTATTDKLQNALTSWRATMWTLLPAC